MAELKSLWNTMTGCALLIGPVFLVLLYFFGQSSAEAFETIFVLWVSASIVIGLTVYFKRRELSR